MVLLAYVSTCLCIHSTIVHSTPFDYYHLTILNTHNNVNYKGCKAFYLKRRLCEVSKVMGGGEAMLVVFI